MMEDQQFYVTYLDVANDPIFSEAVFAPDYWEACTRTQDSLPHGVSDFEIVDPHDGSNERQPIRLRSRREHLRDLRRFVERRQQKTGEFSRRNTPLVFDTMREEDREIALYRLSLKRSAFTASTSASFDYLIAEGLKRRTSESHRHLVGIDPSTGNIVIRLDLNVKSDIYGVAQRH